MYIHVYTVATMHYSVPTKCCYSIHGLSHAQSRYTQVENPNTSGYTQWCNTTKGHVYDSSRSNSLCRAAINNLEWAWEPKAQNIGASPLPVLTMPTPCPQAGCEGERMIKTPSNAEYTKILQCTCSCTQVLMEKLSKMTCIWWKHRLSLILRH